ncbi:coordinator of PRMT5 and differentiation stimulator isoform X1 [Crotalus tigris]|uniref:coordinator of PRMT5 and differentiation stimulator isoform X1 n=1 Tax=Crotalus tigris TaxID=88082 RepID=UPI00192FAF5B|nr:coordinator of PRMT5 and differentiation stimulator isoform X1 [Crotalus tigris]
MQILSTRRDNWFGGPRWHFKTRGFRVDASVLTRLKKKKKELGRLLSDCGIYVIYSCSLLGLTEKVEAKINTLEDCDDFEDFQSENEDWESVDEYCSVATETVFPEMKTVTQYEEEEDWDKEMADSENNKNSYDLDDIIYCGGFRDGNGEASYSVHEEPLYDPSLHHVAPLTLIHLKAVTEDGQFEDAVD